MKDIIVYCMMMGALNSASGLPFWATSNQFGLMPESSGALVAVGANSQFDENRKYQWKWGASLAANVSNNTAANPGSTTKLMVDELYVSMKFRKVPFVLDLGMKHQPMEFLAGTQFSGTHSSLGSLSTTSGHLLWSGNARTLPGYSLHLEPWAIPGTKKVLWIYGTFGDYRTLDHRYCQGELIHSTKAFLRVDLARRFSFHFGLDHYAVWGGSRDLVKVNFGNYLRLITGSKGGPDGTRNDRLNIIGDQGGAELIKLEYQDDRFYAVAQHDIPYSDGSGMGFLNFPDGINTLYFGWKDKDRWVSDILFEYGYTRYQSGPLHHETFDEQGNSTTPPGSCTTGMDNYFNNGEYRDGWTYYGRMMGCPLFFPNAPSAEGYTLGIRNNRFTSHHIAVAGKLFRKAPYKLMFTRSVNYGTYNNPYAGESAAQKPWGSVKETGLRQISAAFTGEVPLPVKILKRMSVTYGLFFDTGEVLPKNFGCSLGLDVIL